jgi:hypothetical protein
MKCEVGPHLFGTAFRSEKWNASGNSYALRFALDYDGRGGAAVGSSAGPYTPSAFRLNVRRKRSDSVRTFATLRNHAAAA